MAFSKEKRKKIEEMIYEVMKRMDKSGYNAEKYKKYFSSMDDKKFTSFMNKFLNDDSENFYIEMTPFEKNKEPLIEDIESAAKYLNIPLDEYIYLPFSNPDGEPLRTKYPVPVG